MNKVFVGILFEMLLVQTGQCQQSERKREGAIPGHDYTVSIVRLIASPENYHDRRVQVKGFLSYRFEGDAIYLHKEDYKKGISKNALWLRFADELDKSKLKDLDKKYVYVEGTFNKNRFGHLGAYSGEINEVTRVRPAN